MEGVSPLLIGHEVPYERTHYACTVNIRVGAELVGTRLFPLKRIASLPGHQSSYTPNPCTLQY